MSEELYLRRALGEIVMGMWGMVSSPHRPQSQGKKPLIALNIHNNADADLSRIREFLDVVRWACDSGPIAYCHGEFMDRLLFEPNGTPMTVVITEAEKIPHTSQAILTLRNNEIAERNLLVLIVRQDPGSLLESGVWQPEFRRIVTTIRYPSPAELANRGMVHLIKENGLLQLSPRRGSRNTSPRRVSVDTP